MGSAWIIRVRIFLEELTAPTHLVSFNTPSTLYHGRPCIIFSPSVRLLGKRAQDAFPRAASQQMGCVGQYPNSRPSLMGMKEIWSFSA